MNRLQCSGKQLPLDVSYRTKPDGKRAPDSVAQKELVPGKPRSLPAQVLPHSVLQSGPHEDEVVGGKEPTPEEFPNLTPGCVLGDEHMTGPGSSEPLLLSSPENVDQRKHEEQARFVAPDPDHGPSMEDLREPQPSDSAKTGEETHSPPSAPLLQPTEPHREGEQTEDDEDEGNRAPLELMAKFLTAVMCRDFKMARILCQMILIYEPENVEARLFLPLIQLKLQEHSNDDEDEEVEQSDSSCEDDDTDDSGSDEESSQSTGSSSPSSSSSEDEEEEKG